MAATERRITEAWGASQPLDIALAMYLPKVRVMMARAAGLTMNTDVHMKRNEMAEPVIERAS